MKKKKFTELTPENISENILNDKVDFWDLQRFLAYNEPKDPNKKPLKGNDTIKW